MFYDLIRVKHTVVMRVFWLLSVFDGAGNNEVSGFGPFETIDFCNAAGILPVMTTAAADHTGNARI